MAKEVICIKFKEDRSIEKCSKLHKSIQDYVGDDYYVIGIHDNYADVVALTPEAKVIYIEDTGYSYNELKKIISKAKKYDDMCAKARAERAW